MFDSELYAGVSFALIPLIITILAEKYFKIFSSVVRSCVFLGAFFIFANIYTLFSVYIQRRYFGEIRDLYVFEQFGWLLMSAFPILATVFFNLIRFICNLLTNPRGGDFCNRLFRLRRRRRVFEISCDFAFRIFGVRRKLRIRGRSDNPQIREIQSSVFRAVHRARAPKRQSCIFADNAARGVGISFNMRIPAYGLSGKNRRGIRREGR